ncbi:MAG: hypothetical protein IT242_07365 [Bacteroidia bacterium]|nr:hypothetical protein [Bacteroidia bacterium]
MKKKSILILTYWSFKDPLIQAYTLPYVHIIRDQVSFNSRIYLLTFEQPGIRMTPNEKAQVVQRLKLQGIRLITLKYRKFGIISFINWIWEAFYLLWIIITKNIRYIHAWCTPAGSIAYILSIITGRTLVIDSYEPHAEAMVENKTWSRKSLQFRLLFRLEKKISARAKIIISATEKMWQYAKSKYNISISNFYVKPACVEPKDFSPEKRKNAELVRQYHLENKIICIYAGKFGGIYLTKEVFDFFKVASDYWGDRFRALLLTNHSLKELNMWAEDAGFDPWKMIVKFVPHEFVPDFMGLGDFGITPVKPIPTKRYCTPIKDGEYWSLGLPVVITPDISDDSDIIKSHNAGAVLEGLNTESYLRAIRKIDELLTRSTTQELIQKITRVANTYRNFSIARNIYRNIYYEGNNGGKPGVETGHAMLKQQLESI